MIEEKLVSIVLPIYNVEKYLDRCINSIINQTYPQLEIILVDDGSPDNCPKLCEEWAKKDKRIKVIHKSNAGLGMARNTGIENATGDYILFIDSDDYVDLDLVEKTLEVALREQSDLVMYGYNRVYADGSVDRSFVPKVDKKLYKDKEIKDVLVPELLIGSQHKNKSSNLCLTACASLFSLSLIKKINWKFVSERTIISEDVYSLLDLLNYAKVVSIMENSFYYYCYNESSLTHSYRKDRYEKIKHFYDETKKLMLRHGYDERAIACLSYPYVSNSMAAMKMIVKSDANNKEKKEEIRKIIYDGHLKNVIKFINFKELPLLKKMFLKCVQFNCVCLCLIMLKVKN